MSTLVLNLDDKVAVNLSVMAARTDQTLPDWAAEQLTKIASVSDPDAAADYPPEWRAAFGSISDPAFEAPLRPVSRSVVSLGDE